MLLLSINMKKNREQKVIYTINPKLQDRKFEFTAESKAFLEKGQLFLKEKGVLNLANLQEIHPFGTLNVKFHKKIIRLDLVIFFFVYL
jgi:hypothetical protein